MAPRGEDDRREWRRGVRFLAVPWMMALAIVLGGLAGWLVDGQTGTFPLVTLLGIAAGVIGGGWYSYRLIMRELEK